MIRIIIESGIIILDVVSGQLRKKARLEVCLDDGYWPAFSTVKARSTQMQWDYVGEGFIKELDFGQVWLRLNEAAEGDKDDIIAQWKGNAKEFLESTLVSFSSSLDCVSGHRTCLFTGATDEVQAAR